MKKILLFTLFILSTATFFAQNRCGYEYSEAEAQRFQETRDLVGHAIIPRAIRYVPIQFHVVGSNAGTGFVSYRRLLNELCYINQQYADQEIQFYIHNDNINYISSTNVYTDPGGAGVNTMIANKVPNVLNMYITQAATTGGIGTTLGYYSPQRDWVVIIKSQIGSDVTSSTVSHEIGHFFGLPHTFNGCDACDWTGTPAPCPAASSYGGVLTEYVNGANCANAGDNFCDTPADINLGFGAPSGPYTGSACDPQGTAYAPDVENFMGYFLGSSDYNFSDEQKTHMSLNLFARQNSNLNLVNNNSVTDPVEENTQITSFETTDDGATITWTSVPNATHYFVEVSRTPSFSNDYHSFDVTETSLSVSGLTFNKKYYVRVMPYNQLGSCYSSYSGSTPDSFVTDVNKTIDQINSWVISPNPNTKSNSTNMLISSTESLDLNISVRNITGKLLINTKENITQGENTISLNTQKLNAGIYFVSLESDKGINVKKMIIR